MQTKKQCSVEGCNNFLYARKFCIYHYKSLYLYPKSLLKKKKIYRIPKSTKKKRDINSEYNDKREMFISSERSKDIKGRLFCIFCGEEIKSDPSLHHALGRDDSIMLDEKFWFLSHNICHVHEYHSISWNKLLWWNEYINRIKHIPEILALEEKRMEK